MHPTLKLGDQGSDVSVLQTALNTAGFPVIAVDGIFGVSTLGAVKAFQRSKGLTADGIVGPLTWAALGDVVVPTPTSQLQLIDVSGYDPHTDWGKVAEAGIAAAFIKATEGYSYVNPYFHTDWRASASAGVLRGAYLFYRPADDAIEQGKHFLNTVGPDIAGTVRPVIDWEVTDGVGASRMKAGVKALSDYLKSVYKVAPFLYYSASWPDTLGDMSEFAENPKWIAEYGPRCRIPFDVWQYTDKGRVPGVQSLVDRSVFNGTLDEFKSKFVVSV